MSLSVCDVAGHVSTISSRGGSVLLGKGGQEVEVNAERTMRMCIKRLSKINCLTSLV